MKDKQHILDEIKRTADRQNGRALGMSAFTTQTGIRKSDWYGRYWRNWGEALKEAGFSPNEFQVAFTEEQLVQSLIELVRELRRFPVEADLRIKACGATGFPSHSSFSRLGGKAARVSKVLGYCSDRPEFADVVEICRAVPKLKAPEAPTPDSQESSEELVIGIVYLLRSGRYHKIGRTNSSGRRERELSIQLPEKASLVHEIRTDDPVGIEAYWHQRFASKRKNGEWFELASSDVAAFRRRKFFM